MEIGKEALDPKYTYVDLFCTVCVLCLEPNHAEFVSKQIYKGVQQDSSEQVYNCIWKE